jgi:hypothetical protein
MIYSSCNNKEFSITNKNPLKKAHCISDKIFVVIDDSLVKQLEIDKDDIWFEQEIIHDGILLRICRKSILSEV